MVLTLMNGYKYKIKVGYYEEIKSDIDCPYKSNNPSAISHMFNCESFEQASF